MLKQNNFCVAFTPKNRKKLVRQRREPSEIEQSENLNDYVVNIREKKITFHANMIKKYHDGDEYVSDLSEHVPSNRERVLDLVRSAVIKFDEVLGFLTTQ